MSASLGEPIVIENRGGAGSTIGTRDAARRPPDGYTLLFSSIPHVINPHLYRKVNYHAIRDFVPVIQFVSVPLMMASAPSFPPRSVKELLTLARAKPDQINYASAGAGSSSHLAMELFKTMGGVRMTHIPYKGTAPMLVDVINGQLSFTFASALGSMPHVKSGRLRAIAVTSAKRSPALADVPTVMESGKDPAGDLADNIAEQIKGWLDSGEQLESRKRPINPADILILVRRRSAGSYQSPVVYSTGTPSFVCSR